MPKRPQPAPKEFTPTFRRQSEDEMLEEVKQNALRRMRALEQGGLVPNPHKLEGIWVPSELWPGEDYLHINNAYTDYRIA